jgi:hypothetical protein
MLKLHSEVLFVIPESVVELEITILVGAASALSFLRFLGSLRVIGARGLRYRLYERPFADDGL